MAKNQRIAKASKIILQNSTINNMAGSIARKERSQILRYLLFLGILSFCIYANTLSNGYALDDWSVIQNNYLVKKGVSAIPQIMSTPYHFGNNDIARHQNEIAKDDQYRPLSLVMLAIQYELMGDNPVVSHFINVVLYVWCVIVFFLFLYHLFLKKQPVISFIGALLFAIHPIHTESVANIKSSDELLCFLFGFLSLNTFIKYHDKGATRSLILGSVFYFLSLFSKETSITFVIIIPLIFFFFKDENRKRSVYISLFSIFFAGLYFAIRLFILVSNHAFDPSHVTLYQNALVAAPSFASRLATEILILGNYLKLLIVPYPLICDYSYNSIPFVNFNSIGVWLSLIIYAALIYTGLLGLIKKRDQPLTFGLLFFLVTISLFSNILFLIQCEMADRFMFFPSAGFCVMIAFTLDKILLKTSGGSITDVTNKKLLLCLLPVSLIFITIIVNRNKDWKDTFTVVLTDCEESPNNFRLQFFASNQDIVKMEDSETDDAKRKELYDDAIKHIRKCIDIYPNYVPANDAIAYDYLIAAKLDSAAFYSLRALKFDAEDVTAMNNLAIIYMGQKKYRWAIEFDKRAIRLDSSSSYYWGNIGECYIYTTHFDSAVYFLRKSLSIDATNNRYIKDLAIAFYAMNQKDSAKKYEIVAQQTDPQFMIDKVAGF